MKFRCTCCFMEEAEYQVFLDGIWHVLCIKCIENRIQENIKASKAKKAVENVANGINEMMMAKWITEIGGTFGKSINKEDDSNSI